MIKSITGCICLCAKETPPNHDPFLDLVPEGGVKLTPRHYAYLKISEGCNNRCSFCIIPKLRGDLVSRPAAHVMAEAEKLVGAGVKELLVISQDTSACGLDIARKQIWREAARITLAVIFFSLIAFLAPSGLREIETAVLASAAMYGLSQQAVMLTLLLSLSFGAWWLATKN